MITSGALKMTNARGGMRTVKIRNRFMLPSLRHHIPNLATRLGGMLSGQSF
jgi:hypothetical protein